MEHHEIRGPCAAGAFYPADPARLKRCVDSLLARAAEKQTIPLPCVLVAPHAGYQFSGQVAACGYSAVQPPERVLLVGVSHHYRVSGALLYDGAGWHTPLGMVPVDHDLVRALCAASPDCSIDHSVHQPEHALEVQLPFLQRISTQLRIVPILLGSSSPQVIQPLSQALARCCDLKTLLVVSSDLSHYPSAVDAERIDRETISALLTGDPERFRQTAARTAAIPGLLTRACSAAAILTGLYTAQILNLVRSRLLAYAHSGCVSGDQGRVVGYASICFNR